MSRIIRIFFTFVGIFTILLLGYALIFRKPSAMKIDPPRQSATEELNSFLTDRMDYGIAFSRIVAEKRIVRAQKIAEEHPESAPRARAVIDTLRSRLERRTRM